MLVPPCHPPTAQLPELYNSTHHQPAIFKYEYAVFRFWFFSLYRYLPDKSMLTGNHFWIICLQHFIFTSHHHLHPLSAATPRPPAGRPAGFSLLSGL